MRVHQCYGRVMMIASDSFAALLASTPYRKDRVRCIAGAERIAEYRLEQKANTRRAVATCCNAPLFLEFKGGHWLSMYAGLWPKETRPAAEMRTMVSDFPEGGNLPNDIPNLRTHSIRFMFRLATAWAKMAFRAPKIDFIRGGTLDGSR